MDMALTNHDFCGDSNLMRRYLAVGLMVSGALLTGCATPLTAPEKLEYESMKRNGLLIEEKSPAAAAVLGILPGCGSFYAGQGSIGLKNFFLWPLSVFWDPVSGYEGAKALNYEVSRREIRNNKDRELATLDDRLRNRQISNSEYQAQKDKVEAKYQY
jgi:hypothetical protein